MHHLQDSDVTSAVSPPLFPRPLPAFVLHNDHVVIQHSVTLSFCHAVVLAIINIPIYVCGWCLVRHEIRTMFRPVVAVVADSVQIRIPLILGEFYQNLITFRHKPCTLPLVPGIEVRREQRHLLFGILIVRRRSSHW